jgi:hypothetical protein
MTQRSVVLFLAYVRGYAVLHSFSTDALAQPDQTIAHEMGHIVLNIHDEGKAERQAMRLLQQYTFERIGGSK